MTFEFVYALVASAAAVLGAIAGRVFAVEAENAPAAILAATYIGAGAGLASSLPLGSILTLIATLWSPEAATSMSDSLDVASQALVLGVASGAAGGLAISLVVLAVRLWQQRTQS